MAESLGMALAKHLVIGAFQQTGHFAKSATRMDGGGTES